MKKWKALLPDKIYILLFFGLVLIFFYPFVFFGKIPIPADTIVGMYHPWRDVVWGNFTIGVPFKNFLITDPVRQQYVWRNLAIEQLKQRQLPLWNPYSFSGTPLLANFQSAAFYPLNILFFILPFNLAWGILVLLQPLLSGIFLYLYLREMKLNKFSSFLAGFVFAFSGFSIAWLEWNTIGHTILWLPLTLLAIEKIIHKRIWSLIFIFSLVSSFFAGHLQVFFYSFLIIMLYLSAKILLLKQNKIKAILFTVYCLLFTVLITSIQWLPTLKFISLSARDFDQGSFLKPGWFIPWQNLIQFLVPDFFGNPATMNYWGIWNYGEFIGFVGVIPMILALYALFFRLDKKTLFFGSFFFLGLLFALPTPAARIPYILEIPFIATGQPTRLLSITCFALAILSGLGLEKCQRDKSIKKILVVLLIPSLILAIGWSAVIFQRRVGVDAEYASIAKRNLILPTLLFIFSSISLIALAKTENKRFSLFIVYSLFFIVVFDLFRFGWKFTPFSSTKWIFPSTKIIELIKKESKHSRFISLDRRIMPPNFSVYYKIQDVSGYDPLYLLLYNQLVSSWDKGQADLTTSAFNRIVTPVNGENSIANLLGIEYIASLTSLKYPWFELITSEGQTYLYRNKNAFPRAFFVDEVLIVSDRQEELAKLFSLNDKLRNIAVSSENINIQPSADLKDDIVSITQYRENFVNLQTRSREEKLLVLADIYYPDWRVFIDGYETKMIRVDFALRAVVVPKGEHKVEFKMNLL